MFKFQINSSGSILLTHFTNVNRISMATSFKRKCHPAIWIMYYGWVMGDRKSSKWNAKHIQILLWHWVDDINFIVYEMTWWKIWICCDSLNAFILSDRVSCFSVCFSFIKIYVIFQFIFKILPSIYHWNDAFLVICVIIK